MLLGLAIAITIPAIEARAQFPWTAFFRHRINSLNFTTTAQSLASWNCSGVTTVESKNASGAVSNVASDLTVNLTGAGSMTFYSDADCTNAITTITILSGQSSANFYFIDSAAGNHAITAAATAYASAIQNATVAPSAFIWMGGGGNALWSTGANWSGGTAPSGSDVAIFNSACTVNCSPTISANMAVGGVRISSGYSGTITQASAAAITVNSYGWVQLAGTFVGSTTADNFIEHGPFNLSGGSFTSTKGILYYTWNFPRFTIGGTGAFTHNSGTVRFDNGLNPTITPGSTVFNNIELANSSNWTGSTLVGTLTVAGDMTIMSSSYAGGFGYGGTINIAGNFISNASDGGWGIAGNCQIRLVGGAGSNVTMSGLGAAMGSIEIASSGTVNISGIVFVQGNFNYTSGIVNAGTSNFRFGGGSVQTITPGAMLFNDVTVFEGAYNTVVFSGTVYVGRDLYLSSNDGRSGVTGGTFEVQRNLTSTSPFNFGDSPIKLTGAGTQTISATAGSVFYSGNITVTGGGNVVLASDISWNSAGQTLTVTTGSVDMAGFALTVKALSLNSTTVTRSAGTLTVNGSAVAAGSQSLYGGTIAP